MAELIAIHQIVTRAKKGGPRIVIKAGERFDPSDYPMISEREWRTMMRGEPQYVRTPDDPAYATPPVAAQRAAADADVREGRSPRTDIGENAPAVTKDGVTLPRTPASATEQEAAEAEAAAADEEARRERVEAARAADTRNRPGNQRGGRRRRAAAEDDDEI